jgi:hypothetical protein
MSTFGKTTIGAIAQNNAAQVQFANARTLGEAGLITKLTAYLDNTHPSSQGLTAAIWANASGSPDVLLAQSASVVIAAGAAAAWVDFPLISNYSAVAGTYWLGIWATTPTNQARRYADTGVNGIMKFRAFVAGGPSDPFGTPSDFTDDASIYATYVAAASAPGGGFRFSF